MTGFLIAAILGWAGGALVNYLADVLPARRRLAPPFCLECQHSQAWANYLFWPRRCPACGRRRPWRTWLVELLFTLATLWLWFSPPVRLSFPAGFVLLVYFAVITVIDIEHRLILHPTSLAGAVLGLGVGIPLHGVWRTLAGGLAGFASMFLLYLLGFLFLRLLKRRSAAEGDEALGFGDVMLGGVLGLILGWPGIFGSLFLTILLAGAASLVYLVAMIVARKYSPALAIPYGPYLILGAVLLLYFPALLVGWAR